MRPLQTPRRRAPTTAAPTRQLSPEPAEAFNPGDPVEVVPDEPGLRGAHIPAVVVGRSTKPRCYTLEYDALTLTDFKGSDHPLRTAVPARILRPHPPPASGEAPAKHAAVDALHNGAWWLGVALGGADVSGKVRVSFPEYQKVMVFDAADVRPHLERVDGNWRSPNIMEMHSTMQYTKGMQIEVSLGGLAAWAPATVAKIIWKNNLLMDYTAPKSDGTYMPKDIVDMKDVRPCPPQVPTISFCINDEVEGFHMGCWMLGVITKVHPGLKYTFKLARLGMEVQLSQKSLRLPYDWVDGIWKQNSQSTTPESSPRPHKAASVVDELPDPAPSLTKKRKFPKVKPSEENKHCEPSSKEIYPDHIEKRPLGDASRPDGQATPAPQPEHTPAPAQRRKGVLKLSLPMNQPTAASDATMSSSTRESDSEKNEAVQNNVTTPVSEAETCSKSPAKSLLSPLDVIIEELKGCREQWLKAQSQLDYSATKSKELEGQVSRLQAASEAEARHLREMMDKQASLEQRLELKDKEIEDMKKKLVDLDGQKSCIEAELPRGAVMAASHALGVLKSHLPDLDIGILSKGYACTPAEAQALADQARPIVETFTERLGLSVSSTSEDEV
ncbi:unnamed protein product [Urochloa decumbens]|uniref:Agenet domain-containing protein n=1 Tax=Urochloa decumbens TaxID=240449 RepID=A0ABC8WIC1_9POAL